ncbi:MAG: S-layer homology domain-containing protein [bacterium]
MKKWMKYCSCLVALVALFAVLAAGAAAAEPEVPDMDMRMVFSPETRLTVYVDNVWSESLSGRFGYGETVSLTAPAVEGKTFSHWEADGSVISYANPLKLTVNAHTTLFAVYARTAPAAKPVAGFTSVTRTNDGERISFQATGSGDAAGIVYSTTTNGSNLKIGGKDVTNVAAEKLSEAAAALPVSALDKNNCWSLELTPESADKVYHARAYVTVDGQTTYGDIKNVKLSALESGVTMVANLGAFDPGLENTLAGLTEGMHTVTFYPNGGVGAVVTQAFPGESVTLRGNSFTRDGYTFSRWSVNEKGGGTTYTDGQTIELSENLTLYAQWWVNSSEMSYAPAVSEAENGAVAVSTGAPQYGETVTITVTPDEGYEVDAVIVKDAEGKALAVTKNPDGTYSFIQPEGNVTIEVTFKEANPCPKDESCPISGFTDMRPAAWYHDGVHYCLENGLMKGVGNGLFDPNGTTSRAMIVTILHRLEKEPAPSAANPFDDVAEGKWYTAAVLWAAENKIVEGYGNAKFGPGDAITREQLAVILYRYARFKGMDVSVGEDTNILSYEDMGEWSGWAVPALQWAVGSGVIQGKDGKLVARGAATRAESATMLQRFCETLTKE